MQIEKIKYPDGSFYPKITEIYPHLSTPEELVFRINNYEDLWFLKQIKDVLDFNKCKTNLTIPCLLDAQADDRFDNNESFNLKLICDFIKDMNWENISIFHPHNESFIKAIIPNINIVNNTSFIKQVLHNIYSDDLILISPDAGSYKWITKLANNLNWKGSILSASKSRKWENNQSILVQDFPNIDLENKPCIITDDILVYGGTFKGLANMLREKNCGKLYLAVSHITVQNHDKDNVFSYFDKVFTTNSKYDVYYERIDGNSGKEIKNLEIIKLF